MQEMPLGIQPCHAITLFANLPGEGGGGGGGHMQ